MENRRLIRWLILVAFLQIILLQPSYAVNPEKLSEDQFVKAYFNMYGDYLSGTKNVTKEKLGDVIEYYMTTDDVAQNLHYVGPGSGEMIGSMLADSGVDFDCGTCDASVLGQKCCLYKIGEKPKVYECVGSEVKTVTGYQWKNLYECTLGCCSNKCCRDPNAPTTTTGATTTTTQPSDSCPSVCSSNGYSVSDCIHSSCSEPSHEGTGSCSGWGSGVCCCSNCGDTICNRNPTDGETPQNCPNDCSGTTTTSVSSTTSTTGGTTTTSSGTTTTTSTTTTTTTPGLPDLSVQSAWNLNNNICYALHNDGAAAPASTSNLTVDGTLVATGSATALSAGSSSSNNCFDSYVWTCSGASDTVRVCADSPGSIAESDETNNCITETLTCSTTTTTGSSTTSTTSSTTSTASTTTSTSPGTSTSTSSNSARMATVAVLV